MAARTITLRKSDTCVICGTQLEVGVEAWWDAAVKTVTCVACRASTNRTQVMLESEGDRGEAGRSAQHEHDRRKSNRKARVRREHPHVGGLLLWLTDPPPHEAAFQTGARGEAAVGASLEKRTTDGPAIILHDRRMPGGRGNIDHLAIAPTGVFVIDAKAYSGKVEVSRPLFGEPKLLIARHDRTTLIDGLDRQVTAVRSALAQSGRANVAVQGVLCFTNADLPLLGLSTLKIRSHLLLYRKALGKRLNAPGPLDTAAIEAVSRQIEAQFPVS